MKLEMSGLYSRCPLRRMCRRWKQFEICSWPISEDASEVKDAIPRHPVWRGPGDRWSRCWLGAASQQHGGRTFKETPSGDNGIHISMSTYSGIHRGLIYSRSCPEWLELTSAPTSTSKPEILIGRQEYNAFFSFFVLEDEDDEEMVET